MERTGGAPQHRRMPRTRSLVFLVLLLSSSALAVQVGDALTVTTSDGQSITGTLVHETSSGLLIKTASRTQLVQYEVITSVTEVSAATAGAQATPVPPARAPAPVQRPSAPPQRALPPPPPADPRREVVEDDGTRPRVSDARVTFLASNKRNFYQVSVRGQQCTTPCTLDLDAGDAFVTASGAGDVNANLALPFGESSVRIQHGGGARGVGLVLQTVGGLIAVASVLVMLYASVVVGLVMVATAVVLAVPGLILFLASPAASMQVTPGRRRAELSGLGWQGV